MARGVRQGCPASGFPFAMAFDPIFRWLQETVILRNPHNLDFLHPVQCAYADDLAVAASSFRDLLTALASAFHSVDHIAGLNLNYRKCCWVQYGTEEPESLCHWISENCGEFREMQIVRHAKHVGTMIGPDGHLHRWTAHQEKFIQRVLKINASTKSLVERLCDFKIYAISVLILIGSVCAPDKATLKTENHALQCTTAGPYNAIPSNFLGVGSVSGLGPDLVGIHSISLAARCRVAACSTTLSQSLEKIQTARGHNSAPSMACSTGNALDIVCRLDRDGKLDEAPQYKKQKVATGLLRHKLHEQDFAGPISLRPSAVLGPISLYRVADIVRDMKLVSRASRPGLIVGALRNFCNGLKDFTLKSMTIRAMLDAQMNLTLSHITTSVPVCTIYSLPSGDKATVLPQRNHLRHDLITHVFLRSLQYGIVVMGFIDAIVYAAITNTVKASRILQELWVIA